MDTNTNSQSITNNQLVYLVDLEEKLKDSMPELKLLSWAELSKEDAAVLIATLRLAVKIKDKKNIVYDYSNKTLTRAVQFFEQRFAEKDNLKNLK